MERIDKILSNVTMFTRKEVRKLLMDNKVSVNGEVIKDFDYKLNGDEVVKIDGEIVNIEEHIYLILNKPEGYVSATTDKKEKTVLDLVPEEFKRKNLFPAGRLDKYTTGLMIITDDGKFAHEILSPRHHIEKEYYVEIDKPITDEMVSGIQSGVMIDGKLTKDATIKIISENSCYIILTEGRYHEIKLMFDKYFARVTKLHRIRMGKLSLPQNLNVGEMRKIDKCDIV